MCVRVARVNTWAARGTIIRAGGRGGVSCSSAVKSFLARYIPARIFSATLTMAEESTSEEKVVSRKVCLHRVEVPVAIKDAAILAADAAMDKYSTEKVRFTLSKGKFALRVPSP